MHRLRRPGAAGLYDPKFEHDACGIGAVAGIELSAARAAVLQVVEHPERLRHGLVRAPVREIGYRADAARIVLKLWVVEARGPWSP